MIADSKVVIMAGSQGVSNRLIYYAKYLQCTTYLNVSRFTFSSLPRTERGQPIVLDKDPKGETFLYCHGNSVIIRNLAR